MINYRLFFVLYLYIRNDTQNLFHGSKTKMIYYLSIEFLLGRSLQNAMLNMKMEGKFSEALDNLGYKLEELYDEV